ncbi:MAG: helix-turn-helix domain-containing protein [Pseudonocardiaceae bacterium]
MQDEAPSTTSQPPVADETAGVPGWRDLMRAQALQNAMHKRAEGVPTYTVPEAAALLSISQEYLYRLIQASVFPAVRMRLGGNQGRYVIPAKAVERLLDDAAAASSCIEVGEWSERWTAGTPRAGVTVR